MRLPMIKIRPSGEYRIFTTGVPYTVILIESSQGESLGLTGTRDSPACKALRPLLTFWVPYLKRKCLIGNLAHSSHTFNSLSRYCVQLSNRNMIWLTHWGWDKIATFLMATFSNSVSWMFEISLKFVPNGPTESTAMSVLIWLLGAEQVTFHNWTSDGPFCLCMNFFNAHLTCKEFLLVHCTTNFAWKIPPFDCAV